ncbi:ABC transporter ATP-binding protein [Lentimicrobium sp.]|jgi:ABC-2 type transport system ATP-binding protein|uniref:ABC transporter ATP-binding protein n=1 Tax=Lentimicrobium sp. TaxID=2034841 RepID=UPI0025F63961|nr:ABC transporter ATP-binding protein [Lentimicrobium sp.]MCO5256023.1 ABC transporter ATP-binding protein [Lentimicrobium sp.]MCO5262776.1 ABC transporter ATP-binding protein [Lentimicrobium sp.]HOP13550.1 ABC transporter ATP-binding protein [Lentimicrobium sp.]HPF64709.1 ABC transporter ATP-binding protein [Lentimicrobium sp.]HPJ61820.1 ABC transporter ATP-binding protein [Lentimicrobium sp.]
MTYFSVKNITKRYAAHTALTNVSIDVPGQSIFGLLGPNGAGKTSLIRIINQITGPDEGEVYFGNEKLAPHHVDRIGYLPEERGLYKKMKVGEQALYLAQLKGVSKADAIKKLKYWFEKFEIQAWWNKKVEELSKGMQQKVQFIVTIIHEPSLLIFDEPFSGFDPINVNLLKDEILNLRKNGATIIFSTHNMASVEELCDNIALINNSHKILEGSVKEIKKRFKTNTYSIDFDGYSGQVQSLLPAGFILAEDKTEDELRQVTVTLPATATQNELLNAFMPYVNIHAFREIIPTMNEIFIKTVHAAGNHSINS